MPSRADAKVVLWPHYFDRTISRRAGRRVDFGLAIDHPKVHDVAKAARSVGLRVDVMENMRHPAAWDRRVGAVLVPCGDDSKQSTLGLVARRL